jgi:glycosyltransferase involved in cell wall biosynthesis
MRRIRVLYVIWSLETGGAEQVVAALAQGLDTQRFSPMVCCLNWEGRLAPEVKAQGIPVFSLDKKKGLDPAIIFKLKRLLQRERIDIVHTHLWTSNFWGRIAATLARTPIIVTTEHNIDVWKSRYHFALDRLLARFTSRVVYVSDSVKSFYVDKTGVDSPKGMRIYNGIDTSRFRKKVDTGALRRELGLPDDTQVVCTIGRLVPQKGHRIFIETMKLVRERCPGAVGLIVGEGQCRKDLDEYNREQGTADSVLLTGLRQDIAEILHLSDLFVLSSYREGFPITILEAMAVGRACVVTDVGGNREAVAPGSTGIVTKVGDPQALAEPIIELLQDSAARVEMGRQARQRIDKLFSVQAMVDQTESLYEELLDPAEESETVT